MSDDPSVKWMLGTMIVVLSGLLVYMVKAHVDKIGPAMERLTQAIECIPKAITDALRAHDSEKDRVH